MSIPFLYSSDDSTNDYNKNGLGSLPDCTSLLSKGTLNGEVSLQGSVPIDKSNVDNIINGNIIKVKINDTQKPQIMRLFNVKKSMNTGLVTFSAEPIANDLRENYIPAYSTEIAYTPVTLFEQLRNRTKPVVPQRFKFYSDKENTALFSIEKVSLLQALGGVEGSILQRFKGEYEKDNHDIYLRKRLGQDHKIKILYTKNLTGLDVEVDTQGIVNGIYPFAKAEDSDSIIEATNQIIYFEKQYHGGTIKDVDFSDKKPTSSAELQKLAEEYIKNNPEINEPTVNAKIDFILLNDQPEYKEFVNMESVGLGDGVDVYHPILDVDLHARVVSYEYDCIREQYTKIEIGSIQANFINQIKDKIDESSKDIDEKVSSLEEAQNEASDIINNPGEGHVVIYPSISDPQEVLIMDTTDVNTAKELWRWNEGGLGFSRNGYAGPYELAMTNNGAIVADRITTGILKAIDIIGVTISGSLISSVGKDFTMEQQNGAITWKRNSDGKEIFKFYTTLINQKEGNVRLDVSDEGSFTIFNKKLNKAFLTFFGATNNMSGSANLDNFYVIGSGHSLNFAPGSFGYSSTASNSPSLNVSSNGFSIGNNDTKVLGSSGGRISISATSTSVTGNLSVTGSKNSLVDTLSYGHRLLNAYETPEYYFADYGKAITDSDGKIKIDIEPIFLETVNTESENYHVMLTPYSKGNIWVEETKEKYFVVKSDPALIEFSWNLVAYRKGYEEVRLTQHM